jgi:FkbM family methyltransferase
MGFTTLQFARGAFDNLLRFRLLRNAFCRASNRARLYGVFEFLKESDFSPGVVYDIGANRGNWTRLALKFFPDAKYILFEPQDWLRESVKDLLQNGGQFVWKNLGVSNAVGSASFTLGKYDAGSNFRLTEARAKERGLQQIDVGLTTIDEAISENEGIIPEMIKIDAEGFDLKVLEGAQLALGKTDVIFCEAAVICPFDNTLASICNYMTDYCYRLVKITDLNDSPNNEMLYLVELVFFREGSPLDGKIPNQY